jgi:hypothetical protein
MSVFFSFPKKFVFRTSQKRSRTLSPTRSRSPQAADPPAAADPQDQWSNTGGSMRIWSGGVHPPPPPLVGFCFRVIGRQPSGLKLAWEFWQNIPLSLQILWRGAEGGGNIYLYTVTKSWMKSITLCRCRRLNYISSSIFGIEPIGRDLTNFFYSVGEGWLHTYIHTYSTFHCINVEGWRTCMFGTFSLLSPLRAARVWNGVGGGGL